MNTTFARSLLPNEGGSKNSDLTWEAFKREMEQRCGVRDADLLREVRLVHDEAGTRWNIQVERP